MKRITLSVFAPVALTLLSAFAHADTLTTFQTLYCTGGSTCSTTAPGAGTSYFSFASSIDVAPDSSFNYTLTVSETTNGGANPTAYMQDFSAQLFYGMMPSVGNLTWVLNPGSWADLADSKSNNGGMCTGSTQGALCGSDDTGGSSLLVSSSALTFEVHGDSSAGTLGELNGGSGVMTYELKTLGTGNADGTGGNVFALSNNVPIDATSTVPEPASFALFGTGLLGMAGVLRRKLKK